MKHFKGFKPYENLKEKALGYNIAYQRDENDECWYELNKQFHPDTMKFVYDKDNGRVISMSRDATSLFPWGHNVTEIENVPEGFNNVTWRFDPETHTVYECPKILAERHENKKNFFIKKVITRASELSIFATTDEERAELEAIRQYIAKIRSMPIETKDDEWPKFSFKE